MEKYIVHYVIDRVTNNHYAMLDFPEIYPRTLQIKSHTLDSLYLVVSKVLTTITDLHYYILVDYNGTSTWEKRPFTVEVYNKYPKLQHIIDSIFYAYSEPYNMSTKLNNGTTQLHLYPAMVDNIMKCYSILAALSEGDVFQNYPILIITDSCQMFSKMSYRIYVGDTIGSHLLLGYSTCITSENVDNKDVYFVKDKFSTELHQYNDYTNDLVDELGSLHRYIGGLLFKGRKLLTNE